MACGVMVEQASSTALWDDEGEEADASRNVRAKTCLECELCMRKPEDTRGFLTDKHVP